MTPESVLLLYNYNYWAFERMWTCIMQLNDEQFTAPLEFSSGPLRNHCVHMMSATRRWMQRLQQIETSPQLVMTDYPTLVSVKTKWDALKTETLAYLGSLDQAQLDEMVAWTLPQREVSSSNRRWEILLHVANHCTDHRAQVMTMLHTHFHVPTVEQDIILYLTEKDGPVA